ncbi:hypothetical protein [Streptomyces xantholiticus]|uniref:DUF1778 domain-containing protein n=1 Tax=Streptomyces xantholiticus TaxID=68285 RepID=A0ABV1UZU4_9ACTN
MDVAQAQALTVPLTAAERDQVQLAAAAAGKALEEFVRDAVLEAAYDPFLAALEQAADTIAARNCDDQVQHDYVA